MSKLSDIPVVIESGQKYRNAHGTVAIKDGMKTQNTSSDASVTHLKKPDWLKIKIQASEKYRHVKNLVSEHKLATVCEEAKCPNISECWSFGTATFMLMGEVCTRACRFCSVDTGNPHGWLDKDEPAKVAHSVEVMQLRYVVLTSVDRDDLKDGGAQHFADTVKMIKVQCPDTKVEALTPDFSGNVNHAKLIVDANLDVFAQNVETVERLTHTVRDRRAGYWQSIQLLANVKAYQPKIITKTSLMLGLGETSEEIEQTMNDLRAHQVDVLTLGQYLQPTRNHLPIERYVPVEEFEYYRKIGLEKGFLEVASGPLVRSSYRADRIFTDDNLGL